eukprot:gnl/Dysnectes_brevis/6789_a10797_507.p1 GENE.gnl/Dysnectes_brevis/6789_a10797_507~~gnl/Dysnectes_brevis/6789_a10797_507.p1  ORF type:complete len:160 (-),score=1.65 gnl/Dysnectes_brevis/6789_a10797_507:122-601(-)
MALPFHDPFTTPKLGGVRLGNTHGNAAPAFPTIGEHTDYFTFNADNQPPQPKKPRNLFEDFDSAVYRSKTNLPQPPKVDISAPKVESPSLSRSATLQRDDLISSSGTIAPKLSCRRRVRVFMDQPQVRKPAVQPPARRCPSPAVPGYLEQSLVDQGILL